MMLDSLDKGDKMERRESGGRVRVKLQALLPLDAPPRVAPPFSQTFNGR